MEDKNIQNEDKYTLLHCAAEFGRLDVVEYLIPLLNEKMPKTGTITVRSADDAYGSNTGPKRVDKVTPLHVAAEKGHLSIIEFILPYLNCDINPARGDGKTVLDVAALWGHLSVVAFYTSKLDNPNPGKISNDKFEGRTPLHYAAQEGHLEVVKHLCNLLQDKNPRDANGATPLHLAAQHGEIHTLKYLVQFVENKNLKTGSFWNYRTPLDLAKACGKTEVVNFLQNQ